MKITVSKYKWARTALKTFQETHPDTPLLNNLTVLSVYTGVPLIALYYMAEKEFGKSEELTEAIETVIKFYGYTKIEGLDEI